MRNINIMGDNPLNIAYRKPRVTLSNQGENTSHKGILVTYKFVFNE